jgi:hypothetical protein
MDRARELEPGDVAPPLPRRANVRRVVGLGSLLAFLTALVATSEPRLTGDGPEYVAQALRLRALRPPSLTEAEATAMNAVVFTGYRLEQNTLPRMRIDAYASLADSRGRRAWPHFWLYPLLAVPFVWMARAIGLRHLWTFTALNVALLGVAFWVVSGRLRWAAMALLFAGPIVWWIDKAHTEVMTFALLSTGLVLAAERPWWSAVAFGAAAAQNSFLAAGIPLVAAAAIVEDTRLFRDRRLWTGVAVGVGIALAKPLYYLWEIGVAEPQTLVGGTHFRIPTLEEAGVLVWDPNIGLLQGFPVFLIVVPLAAVWLALRVPALLRSPWPWAVGAFGVTILLSAAQTTNMNSSATPSMSRYALMLVPLAVLLLLAAQERLGRRFERILVPLAALSVAFSLVNFHPRLAVDHLRPTPLASFLWSRYPGLDNPPPEVFFDRTRHEDRGHRLESVGTPTCSKVLLLEGIWPSECPSDAAAPPVCRRPDEYCYANRDGGTYRFVHAAPHHR